MKRPRPVELRFARELAEVVLVDAVLQTLDDVLLHEHPTVDDLAENDPPSLVAARRIRAAVRALRADLRRYRAAVLEHQPESDLDDLPF
jgi:hypothetical protein